MPLEHALFHTLYDIRRILQVPSINFWSRSGETSERGRDSAVPHVRAILDEDDGRIMVLMTHNTDFGDAFEREGDDHRLLPAVRARGLRVRRQRHCLFDDSLSGRHAAAASG